MTRTHAASGSPYEKKHRLQAARSASATVVGVSGTAPVWSDGYRRPGPGGTGPALLGDRARRAGRLGGRPEDVIRTRQYVIAAADAEAVGAVHGDVFGAAASGIDDGSGGRAARPAVEVARSSSTRSSTEPRRRSSWSRGGASRSARGGGARAAARGATWLPRASPVVAHGWDHQPQPPALGRVPADESARYAGPVRPRRGKAWVQRALARRSEPSEPLRVCEADLEDELIRALGVPACVEVIDARQGDSAPPGRP